MELPDRFIRNLFGLYGKRADVWLRALPEKLKAIEDRYGIVVLPPYPNLTYNFVAPAECATGPLVLKFGPINPELLSEIDALKAFRGKGTVRLIACDVNQGYMLLRRIDPGRPLTQMVVMGYEEEAASVVCDVLRRLHSSGAPTRNFRTTRELVSGFERFLRHVHNNADQDVRELMMRAMAIWLHLEESAAPHVLLHGDLHHDNILMNDDTWTAIDPKGYAGEPAFDTGASIRNLWRDRCAIPDMRGTLLERVELLARGLHISPRRILAWSACQAALSVCWSFEDADPDWATELDVASMLMSVYQESGA